MKKIKPIISKISVFGHPLHPMTVHFPIAALLGVIGTDIGYILTEDFFWARASLWLAGVGAAAGWVAGMIGLAELVSVADIRRLITGWCHGVLAVMLLSLATFNWLLRLEDPAAVIMPWGFGVSLLSGAFIVMTALLGGQLVYEHAVGLETEH